jgi:hypothetical protein
MKNSIWQIKNKNSVENIYIRLDEIEDRLWRLEDKIGVLEHNDKGIVKNYRSKNRTCKTSGIV